MGQQNPPKFEFEVVFLQGTLEDVGECDVPWGVTPLTELRGKVDLHWQSDKVLLEEVVSDVLVNSFKVSPLATGVIC